MTNKLCCCIPFLCKDKPGPPSPGAPGCHEAPSSSASNDTTKSDIVVDEGKDAVDMDKLHSAGTPRCYEDPSSSSSNEATESDILNSISGKDITEVDGKDMVDLGELVKDISKLLNLRMRKKEEQVHKKKWTDKKWICPGGSDLSNLQKILSSGIGTLSDLKEYISGPLKTLLKEIGSASLVTAGLLVLAYTLERLDDISTNKEQCWNLLKQMSYVATVLQNLKDTSKEVIVEATSLIAKGAIMCCGQIASSPWKTFLSASKSKEDLEDIRQKLTVMYQQIDMEIGLRTRTDIERILDAMEQINQKAPLSISYPTHAVGIDTPIKEVLELLECDSREKAVAVILHGFGGMGKTTLADAVFSRVFSQVPGCRYSEVQLFKDINSQPDIINLQKLILKDLMEDKKPIPDIRKYEDGQGALEALLREVEAFIYIDNVLDRGALRKLLPQDLTTAMKVRFLLTARNEDVNTVCPRPCTNPKIYRMNGIQQPEARTILEREIHGELNDRQFNDIIKICGEIPLMLTLAAAFIGRAHDKQKAYSTLMQQKDKLTSEDFKEMRYAFAYDAIPGDCKDPFLDICSYFNGWDWDRVEDIVGEYQLKMLASRALVTRTTDGVVNIHDVILKLARQMSEEESKGKVVRLKFTSATKLKGFLEKEDLKGIKGIWSTDDDNVLEIPAKTLDSMHESLRVLKLGKLTKVEDKCSKIFKELVLLEAKITHLPFDVSKSEQMRYLSYKPNDFKLSKMPRYLRHVELDGSSHSQAFSFSSTELGQIKYLQVLRLVNFSKFKNLPKEFGEKVNGLRELSLSGCESIKQLPHSISDLRTLRILTVNNCSSLTELLVNFESLTSLQELNLSSCSELKALPDSVEKLSSLTLLNLSYCTDLLELPPGLGNLTGLVKLDIRGCRQLKGIPESIGKLKLSGYLFLDSCNTLIELPHGFSKLSSITDLSFRFCFRLEKLPDGFGQLTSLQALHLSYCSKLKKLPEGFGELKNLKVLDLQCCRSLRELCNDFHCLSSLQNLTLSACATLKSLPEDFHCLTSLQHLYLSHCPNLEGKSMDHMVKMNRLQLVHIEESEQLIKRWAKIQSDGYESWFFPVFTGQHLSMSESQKENIENNVLSELGLLTNGRGEPCHLSDPPPNTLILLIRDHYAEKDAFPWPLIEEGIDEMQINFEVIYIGEYFDYLSTKVKDSIFTFHANFARANEMLEKVCLTLDAAVPDDKGSWYLQIDRKNAGAGKSDKYRPCWKFLSDGELEELVVGKCLRYLRLKELVETEDQASNTELLRELFAPPEGDETTHVFEKNQSSQENPRGNSEVKTTKCGVDRFKGKTILLEMRRPADLRYHYRLQSLKEMYAVVEKEQLDLEIISIPILGPDDDAFEVYKKFIREVPWFVLQNSWTVIKSVAKFFLAKQCTWEKSNECEKWHPTVNWIIEPNGGITIYRPLISLKNRGEVFKVLINYLESESYQARWGVKASLVTYDNLEELKKREWEQLKHMSALEFLFNHLESASAQVKKLMFQGKVICLYSGYDEDAIWSIGNAMVQFRESIHIIHMKYKLARFHISDTIFKSYYDYSSENITEMEVMSGLNLSMQETARFSMRLHHWEEEINGMDKSEKQVCQLKKLLHCVQIRDEDQRYGSITFMDEGGESRCCFQRRNCAEDFHGWER